MGEFVAKFTICGSWGMMDGRIIIEIIKTGIRFWI